MNIHELSTYNLADAVKFHRRLNPRIWGRDEHLLPEVRERLLTIAADFQEFLGVEDLNVKDITVSGSNAAYSYTKNSDIDLHLVVEMPADPVYQELFNAKKYQYNSEHSIRIGGADVELYVQPADQTHHSLGIYSVKNSDWISIPQRKRAQIDDACVRDKVSDLDARIHAAVQSKDLGRISTLWDKVKTMRQAGLEQQGEFGCENIAFKMLRNSGCIATLKDAKTALQDLELSLREEPQKRFRYGFDSEVNEASTPDGVGPTTQMFLNEDDEIESKVRDFIQHVTTELGIDPMPEIHLHTDPEWSVHNHSFGRYDPVSHTLNVSMPNRHVLDVLRTVAHELVHCSQNQQQGGLPDDAGETGSRWENDANARAGIIMRDWANSHPEHFAHDALEEGASGYIPKNKREARMPQYAMALSVDIKPGQVGKEANKLGLKTGRNGEPGLLMPEAQNLLREFAEFAEEQDNLFEITMSPSSLRKLSAQTGALAGMEFEMCVPGAGDNDDGDQEPDYDFDQRCRSIQDARDFFYDGDFNSRRDVENMSDRMQNDFSEWLDDKLNQDWQRGGEEYLEEWVPNNVDESEWNPEGLEGEARAEALEEFVAAMHANPGSSDAFDEYREENQDSYDESDWLDAEDLDLMSGVENAYSINWPHWRSTGGGERSIEDVADSFRDSVGRPILASTSYHSGRVERPSTKNLAYIVEPDSSIDVDDNNDQGLEFVSPPLPIEELLNDLNKVKAWADRTGCYTNDSTGLHINVSVPGWTGGTDQLDYVKLALLLGDEFVLDSFGRAGNTYAKSAMGKIRDAVKKSPDRAKEMLDKMKSGMDQLASKVVHSRSTDKYTSINVKDGYIEFRSPGGDWLNDKFPEIENTLRRFTVALNAAVDPDAYREEYLKKLYKLLDPAGGESKGLSGKGTKDTIKYFADYVAGKTPKAALRSFVRQAQLERGVKRDKAQEPQGVDTRVDYELYSRASGAVIDTFPARNDDEAQIRLNDYREHGAGQSNPDNFGIRRGPGVSAAASPTASHPEGRGRPHDPTGRYGIVARSDQAAYGRTGGPPPAYQFRFDMANLEDQGHGRYVLQAWAARNSVDPADYIVVDTTQYADADQGGIIDVEPAQQPAGMAQWNGQWKVLVDGEEVYRFGGVGNSQADANRIGRDWILQQIRQGTLNPVEGADIEILPVMSESLTETNRLTLRDFDVKLSPHHRDQAHAKGVDLRRVDDVLFNLSKVKDKIMSLEPGRAFILHNGQGTGMGMRRHQGNRLTLATVYPTKAGFTKGQHPTFLVDTGSGINEDSEQKPVTIYTNPANQGATVDDSIKTTLPVIQVPFDKLQQWESHKTMQDPRVADWVNNKLLPQLQQNGTLDPLSVWDHDGELFVIDGNHRFVAYQEAGYNGRVPVQIVPDKMITIVDTVMSEQGVAEGLVYEVDASAVRFQTASTDNYQSSFTVTAIADGKNVGHFSFFRDPETDDVHNQAEVTDDVRGKGYGKALLLKAIEVANDHGLGFQEDSQSLSRAQSRVYDSLYDAGWIVDADGYWFLTPEGEQELVRLSTIQQGVTENFADGKNPGRKGLAKRSGVNTKASVSSLRKTAKNSSGEKQRMSHWLANMKSGREKARRK